MPRMGRKGAKRVLQEIVVAALGSKALDLHRACEGKASRYAELATALAELGEQAASTVVIEAMDERCDTEVRDAS